MMTTSTNGSSRQSITTRPPEQVRRLRPCGIRDTLHRPRPHLNQYRDSHRHPPVWPVHSGHNYNISFSIGRLRRRIIQLIMYTEIRQMMIIFRDMICFSFCLFAQFWILCDTMCGSYFIVSINYRFSTVNQLRIIMEIQWKTSEKGNERKLTKNAKNFKNRLLLTTVNNRKPFVHVKLLAKS